MVSHFTVDRHIQHEQQFLFFSFSFFLIGSNFSSPNRSNEQTVCHFTVNRHIQHERESNDLDQYFSLSLFFYFFFNSLID